jgi:predicted nucleic-acid-binding protein
MGRRAVRIAPDANILLRAVIGDDSRQSPVAKSELDRADTIVIALPALCEFVWVLAQGYKYAKGEIIAAVRLLTDPANVVTDRLAAEAGIAMLDAGGDFADGAIAYYGRESGAEFVSFDRRAVKLLTAKGEQARLLDWRK